MKYLLRSSDFTYDTTTFKFFLNLTDKLRTNRALKLDNVAFQLRTDMTGSEAPHCLLLCSNLAQLSSKVVFQTAGLNRFDDVVGLLFEINSGRYVLKTPLSIHVENKDVPRIEFWIRTETGEQLKLAAGEPKPGEASSINDSVIEGITGLKLFQDMKANTLLSSAYAETPAIGDSCRYIYQNSNADTTMVFSGYADFTVSVWGLGRGVSSTNSWNYFADGSMPNKWNGYRFTYVWGMKSPQNQAYKVLLFNHRGLIVDLIGGNLSIQDSTGQDQSTNIPLLPLKDYIITIKRVADQDGDGNDDFEVEVEKLEDNSKQTATVQCGQDPTNQTNWYYSTAQQHFWDQTGVLGPLIAFESVNLTDIANCQDWIRQTYSGSSGSNSAPAGTVNSSFAIEMDV